MAADEPQIVTICPEHLLSLTRPTDMMMVMMMTTLVMMVAMTRMFSGQPLNDDDDYSRVDDHHTQDSGHQDNKTFFFQHLFNKIIIDAKS